MVSLSYSPSPLSLLKLRPRSFPRFRNPNPNPNNPRSTSTRLTVNFQRYPSSSSSPVVSVLASEERETRSLGEVTRPDFPILHQVINGSNLVYFDNAATSQKPYEVLKVLNEYYENINSNVHRGIHTLSVRATDAYEGARTKVAGFVNAKEAREVVFTRNATEAINLVAYSWGLLNLKSGDEILLTIAEHHSAIVPWQFVAKKTGATLKYVGLTEDEVPDIKQLKELLSKKTKLVVTQHVSNMLVC